MEPSRSLYLEQVHRTGPEPPVAELILSNRHDNFGGSWLRCLLVWDKQPNNGPIPSFETMFGQTDQTGAETSSISDHLRYDNMFRFKVLLDDTINPTITNATTSTVTNPATGGLSSVTVLRYHKFIKLGNRMTNFSGLPTQLQMRTFQLVPFI